MVKENTHLYGAEVISQRIKDKEISTIIENHPNQYYVGSVLPDTFYSASKEVKAISEEFHGKTGVPTNNMIFDMLDYARNSKDISLAFGYITHTALDIIFHPPIIEYSEQESKRQNISPFRIHSRIETELDKELNDSFYLEELVNKDDLLETSTAELISDRSGIKEKKIIKAFGSQLFMHKMYRKPFSRGLVNKLKLIIPQISELDGLFYDEESQYDFKEVFKGKDIKDLLEQSYTLAEERIIAAHQYYKGEILEDQAKKIIRGESLLTGKII